MAKIVLNIVTEAAKSKKEIDALKISIDTIAQSLSNIKVDKNLTAQINALTKHYKAVAAAAEKVQKVNYHNKIQEEKLKTQIEKTNTAIQRRINLQNQAARAAQREAEAKEKAAQREARANKKLSDTVVSLRKGYANLLTSIQGSEKNYAKGTFSSIAENAKKNLDILKKLDPKSADYAKTVEKLSKELNSLSASFSETRANSTNFHGSLKDIILGFGKFQLAATAIMVPLNLLKDAWESINETLKESEERLVSIRRVMKETETVSNAQITEELYNLAQRYSKEVGEVSTVIQNFLRSGKSWDDSILATESALKAMTVAELDATESSEGLLSIMTQFKLEAKETEKVVAILNKTADRYNVSTENLLEGLSKTGSYAKTANLTLEDTVAILTVLSENTNAGGYQLGNAVKSLLAYSTKEESLNTYASLSQNMEEVVRQYRMGATSILEVWKSLGSEIQSLNEEQASKLMQLSSNIGLEEELEEELSDIYDEMTGVYDTAGTYRKNFFIALMNDIGKVDLVMEDMRDSIEYSNTEVEEALDTYNNKVISLKSQWEELASDQEGILGFKTTLVEIGSTFLYIIELVGILDDAWDVWLEKVSGWSNQESSNFWEKVYSWLPEKWSVAIKSADAATKEFFASEETSPNDLLSNLVEKARSLILGTPPITEKEENSTVGTGGSSGTGETNGKTDFKTLIENAKNLVNLRKSELKLLEAQGASEEKIKEKKDQIFDALSKQIGLLIDQGGNEIEINNLLAERVELCQDLNNQYDDIVSALEKARDIQKESYEFEEKKKAVLEAEKALEEAQKNRLVQVYNAETGRFEFVANQKDIQNAKDDLDKARRDVENSAWDEVIKILKSEDGNLTKAKEVLEKWSGAYGTGSASFQNDMEEILYGSAFKTVQDFVTSHGIFASGASEPLETFIGMPGYEDLTDAFNALPDEWKKKITDKTGTPLYDHGGILNGLGGIKATTRPETVLDPEMTAKILEPTSNAQFASFARSMGLLFGASKSLASPSSPMIQRAISSDRHDRHYTVNGVPVTTQMAEQYTIKELFELMPLV